MARKPRLVRTGTIYHVRARTLPGVPLDEADRIDRGHMLADSFVRTDTAALGWRIGDCGLDALTVPMREGALSDWLRWALTTCAVRVHRRRGFGGSLWCRHATSTAVQAGYWAGMVLAWMEEVEPMPTGRALSASSPRLGASRGVYGTGGDAPAPAWSRAHITLAGKPHRLWAPPSPKEVDFALVTDSLDRGRALGDPVWAEWYAAVTATAAEPRPRGRPRRSA